MRRPSLRGSPALRHAPAALVSPGRGSGRRRLVPSQRIRPPDLVISDTMLPGEKVAHYGFGFARPLTAFGRP
jgi:hypothetical protein